METNEQPGSHKKFFIAAIILLALGNAVLGFFLFRENKQKIEVSTQKAEVETSYTNLEGDYHQVMSSLDAASLEIGQLKGQNAELDRIIAEKQAMIEEEKKNLDEAFTQNRLTNSALSKARTMITQYESSIASLQRKIDEFAQQNQQLTAHNEKLEVDLTCEKETSTALTQKITTASYLNIPNVEVTGVKKNIIGNEVCVSRVKAAENLKISFETGVNKALDPGKLSLYVRIINPKGETIAIAEQGSGLIPNEENGKPVPYTKKTDISWNQKNKKVVMYWGRHIEQPGTYKVEIYQSGKVVGKGAVKLV